LLLTKLFAFVEAQEVHAPAYFAGRVSARVDVRVIGCPSVTANALRNARRFESSASRVRGERRNLQMLSITAAPVVALDVIKTHPVRQRSALELPCHSMSEAFDMNASPCIVDAVRDGDAAIALLREPLPLDAAGMT
jgi:hypothetical protein